MKAADVRRELTERGYAIWPAAFEAPHVEAIRDAIERVWRDAGEPALYDEAGLEAAPGVSIGSNGLNTYALLERAPELASIFDRDDVLDVFEAVVGAEGRVEALSGNLSDETRPFCFWHNHVGGPGAMRYRGRGVYPPPLERIERLVFVIYLSPLRPELGSMLVVPRRPSDAVEPPHADFGSAEWPEQVELACEAGDVVMLDQCTWHAVTRQRTPGRRAFAGFYLVAPAGLTIRDAVPESALPASASPRLRRWFSGLSPAAAPLVSASEPAFEGELARCEARLQDSGMQLRSVSSRGATVRFALERAGESIGVDVSPSAETERAFTRVGDHAIGYRGKDRDGGPAAAEHIARWLAELEGDLLELARAHARRAFDGGEP